MRNTALILALAATTFLAAPHDSPAQEAITGDIVGKSDAPNKLVFRMTTDGPRNNEPAYAQGYSKLFNDFIGKHSDWQIELQMMSGDIGQEQARMLEQAESGSGPRLCSRRFLRVAALQESRRLAVLLTLLHERGN